MTKGVIHLSSLTSVEPFVRKVFLSWIAKSMATKDRVVKTDYGLIVKVKLDKSQLITLEAEDGNLRMPNAIFEFQGKGDKNGSNTNF